MGRISITARARSDLDDIWLYIASDSPVAADRQIDRIVDRIEALATHPKLGKTCPEIAPDARMLIIGDYLALYRIDGAALEIVRVVHGARRLSGLFDAKRDDG